MPTNSVRAKIPAGGRNRQATCFLPVADPAAYCAPMEPAPDRPAKLPAGDPSREPIYRIIRIAMAVDALVGLLLVIFGPGLTGTDGVRILGACLFVIGAGLYWFFGRLAAKARKG